MDEQRGESRLPANAYKPLGPGEQYIPYVPADQVIPEVTVRSVVTGLIMTVIFTAAAAYLGLKIGQVFEAAIPIAILAVGLAGIYSPRSTISENVIIQSIGSASGVVVAGMIFTLPAIFILRERAARASPIPGGHGDSGGPRHRRKGWRAGQGSRQGRDHWRSLRFSRRDLRPLARGRIDPRRAGPRCGGR